VKITIPFHQSFYDKDGNPQKVQTVNVWNLIKEFVKEIHWSQNGVVRDEKTYFKL